MNKAYYIDDNTRIVWRFSSLALNDVHVLERKKSWWRFSWWELKSYAFHIDRYDNSMQMLIDYLLDKEKKTNFKPNQFKGYPNEK
jgi:hypothetical protein